MSHPAQAWLCFAQLRLRVSPALLEIGFVLPKLFTGPTHHNSLCGKYVPLRPLQGNWVCFAHLILQLATDYQLPSFGFVRRKTADGMDDTEETIEVLFYSCVIGAIRC